MFFSHLCQQSLTLHNVFNNLATISRKKRQELVVHGEKGKDLIGNPLILFHGKCINVFDISVDCCECGAKKIW